MVLLCGGFNIDEYDLKHLHEAHIYIVIFECQNASVELFILHIIKGFELTCFIFRFSIQNRVIAYD